MPLTQTDLDTWIDSQSPQPAKPERTQQDLDSWLEANSQPSTTSAAVGQQPTRGALFPNYAPDSAATSPLPENPWGNPSHVGFGNDDYEASDLAAEHRNAMDFLAGQHDLEAARRQQEAQDAFDATRGSIAGNAIRTAMGRVGGEQTGPVERFFREDLNAPDISGGPALGALVDRYVNKVPAGIAAAADSVANLPLPGNVAQPVEKVPEPEYLPENGILQKGAGMLGEMTPTFPAYGYGAGLTGGGIIGSALGMAGTGAVFSQEGRTIPGAAMNLFMGGSLVPASAAASMVGTAARARGGIARDLAPAIERLVAAGGAGLPPAAISAAAGAGTQQAAADALLNGGIAALLHQSHPEHARATKAVERIETVEAHPEVVAADRTVMDARALEQSAQGTDISVEARQGLTKALASAEEQAAEKRKTVSAEVEKEQDRQEKAAAQNAGPEIVKAGASDTLADAPAAPPDTPTFTSETPGRTSPPSLEITDPHSAPSGPAPVVGASPETHPLLPVHVGAEAEYIHPSDTPDRAHKVRYALASLDDLIPSHLPDRGFAAHPDYPPGLQDRDYSGDVGEQQKVGRNAGNLDPRLIVNRGLRADDAPPIIDRHGVILSGNSRAMSLRMARELSPERFAGYRDYLREHAGEFGLHPDQVDTMPDPVLVRLANVTPEEAGPFAAKANASAGARMTNAQMAATLVNKLPREATDQLLLASDADRLGDALSEPRVQASLGKAVETLLGPNEAKAFFSNGALTAEGKELAKQALYFKAIGDTDLARYVAADEKGLRQKIENALWQVNRIHAEGGHGWEIKKPLQQAIPLIAESVRAKSAADVLGQGDFTKQGEAKPIGPKAAALVQALMGPPTRLREVLKPYVEAATGQGGMFDPPKPGPLLYELSFGHPLSAGKPLEAKPQPTRKQLKQAQDAATGQMFETDAGGNMRAKGAEDLSYSLETPSKEPPKGSGIGRSEFDVEPEPSFKALSAKNPVTGEELRPMDSVAIYSVAEGLFDDMKVFSKAKKPGALGFVRKLGDSSYAKLTLGIRRDLATNPELLSKVFAHEVGHAVDYMPRVGASDAEAMTLKRGNLVGHLAALRKYMMARFGADLATNSVYREELINLTRWWNPYNFEKAPPQYNRYRNSPKELYAEFTSVLLNSPGEAERRAPNFFNAFFRELHRRPEAQEALHGVWDTLRDAPAELAAKRSDDLIKDFEAGSEKRRELVAMKGEKRRPGFVEQYVEQFQAFRRKAKQLPGKMAIDAVEPVERWLRDPAGWKAVRAAAHIQDVTEQSHLNRRLIGEAMFLERIAAGDRAIHINPRNYTAETARIQLEQMRASLTPEQRAGLDESLATIRTLGGETLQGLKRVGYLSDKSFAYFTRSGLHEKYAPFAVVEHLLPEESAAFEAQKGTLKRVADPLETYLLKLEVQQRIVEKFDAVNSILDTMSGFGEAETARVTDAGHAVPEPGMGLTYRFRDGKKEYWNLDPVLADAINTRGGSQPLGPFWRIIGKVNEFQKALYLTYSLKFTLGFQPVRDLTKNWQALPYKGKVPGAKLARAAGDYFGSIPEAIRYARSEETPRLRKMIEDAEIEPYGNGLYSGRHTSAKEALLERLDLAEKKDPTRFEKLRQSRYIGAPLRFMEALAQTSEVLPKIAAHRMLERETGWTPQEIAQFTRNYVGTPNYHNRGFTRRTNILFQFYNVAAQGLRADLALMRRSPFKSGAGFAARTAMLATIPLTVQLLAEHGLFGDEAKEAYQKMSDFDKRNMICIWLGTWRETKDGGREPTYLRLPLPETARMVKGMLYSSAATARGSQTAADWMDLVQTAASYLPSMTSNLQVLSSWGSFAMGGPVHDYFRHRDIVTSDERQAGFSYSLPKMLEYTTDQMGMSLPITGNSPATMLPQFNVLGGFVRGVPYINPQRSAAPFTNDELAILRELSAEKAAKSVESHELLQKARSGDSDAESQLTKRQKSALEKERRMSPLQRAAYRRGMSKEDRRNLSAN